MFILKKILAPFLFPVPIVMLVLAIGLARMWIKHRKNPPKGRNWLTFGFLLLAIFSFKPLPTYFLGELEGRYPDFKSGGTDAEIAAVVVLAGGVSDDPDLDPLQRLSEATLVRLAEGIRIAREHPAADLVVSGGAPFTEVSAAAMMAAAAEDLGFDPQRIRREDLSLDTDDQAKAMAAMYPESKFVLVTSAYHMPRTLQLFRKQGLDPIPAPSNRLIRYPRSLHPGAYFPSSINLEHTRIFLRESAGMAWADIVTAVGE